MSRSRRKFSDLTRQEKVWVVGGTAEFFFIFASFLLYYQFFIVEDRLHIVSLMNAGAILTATRMLAPSLFLITGSPALILFGGIACHFAGLSASDALKGIAIALAVSSIPFVFSAVLLTFLDMLFSDASIGIQAMLMILALFISLMLTVRVLKFKRVQSYLKLLQ